MKVIALCVFLVAMVKTHVSGNAVEGLVGGGKTIEKRFDFIKNKEKIVEKILIKDLEAKFIVENTGMNFILNYDVNINNIVFNYPEKKGFCFIAKFDDKLKSKIPFKELKDIVIQNKEGNLPFPKEVYKVKKYEKIEQAKEFNNYGAMARQMCRGLTHVMVTLEEQTTAVAVHDHVRGKREVGVGEVILIIIIILIFL